MADGRMEFPDPEKTWRGAEWFEAQAYSEVLGLGVRENSLQTPA